MHHPKFVVKKSGSWFHFRLTASNGEIILSAMDSGTVTRQRSSGGDVEDVRSC
jgi:uncharacterized protein YegP (UPF0339 family)